MAKSKIKIAIVGDVHDQWSMADCQALEHLAVDLVLFVGDFGNEAIEIVREIASLELPKAVILGNHDAWYAIRRKKNSDQPDGVKIQLELLGNSHVGFSYLDFADLNLSVIGSRPFSWGGQKWKNSDFYGDRYGIRSFTESTALIMESVQKCAYSNLIFLGHNGATGLGDRPWDICGIDWQVSGGDYGDPDLAEAIAQTQNLHKNVALVAFGHMHHRVKVSSDRQRTSVVKKANVVYVNAAAVPRVRENSGESNFHNFTVVTMENSLLLNSYQVSQVALIWVSPEEGIISEQISYSN
jgi:uncharacterized protein (TIGR04168 family)